MSEETLVHFSVYLLLLFTLIAGLDGLYLHFVKYRLYAHESSIFEHKLHTLNAVIFPFTILCMFTFFSVGWVLWSGVVLTLGTFALELRDVACEPNSRAPMGGLTGFESTLHFAMGLFRCGYSAFIFASRPAGAWDFNQGIMREDSTGEFHYPFLAGTQMPFWMQWAVWIIIGVGIAVGILHVVLMLKGLRMIARNKLLIRA